ncbi:MAG: hypothetical protein EZS28_052473, partial [Streblomastix strix]
MEGFPLFIKVQEFRGRLENDTLKKFFLSDGIKVFDLWKDLTSEWSKNIQKLLNHCYKKFLKRAIEVAEEDGQYIEDTDDDDDESNNLLNDQEWYGKGDEDHFIDDGSPNQALQQGQSTADFLTGQNFDIDQDNFFTKNRQQQQNGGVRHLQLLNSDSLGIQLQANNQRQLTGVPATYLQPQAPKPPNKG